MTTRINGGIDSGSWLVGNLNHFLLSGVTFNLITNAADPRSAVELIVEHIATRANPVIIGPIVQTGTGPDTWGFSFAVERVDTLDPGDVVTALNAITSIPDGPDATATLAGLTITEVNYDFS